MQLVVLTTTMVVTTGVDKSYTVVDCKFYVYGNVLNVDGSAAYAWILVGTSARSTYTYDATLPDSFEISSNALLQYFTVNVDTTQFKDGAVQLKVVTSTTTAGELSSILGATVANTGRLLCYSVSDLGGQYAVHRGMPLSLTVESCTTDAAVNAGLLAQYTISSVTLFEESVTANKLTSRRISSATTAPYSFTTSGTLLEVGLQVNYRAMVKSVDNMSGVTYETSAIFSTVLKHSAPTGQPTSQPTGQPTSVPTSFPSSRPTSVPTSFPSSRPTSFPTSLPTSRPTSCPTSCPTSRPTSFPSSRPSSQPSATQTFSSTDIPTSEPSYDPTSMPTAIPTVKPSAVPTAKPSAIPTVGRPLITSGSHCMDYVNASTAVISSRSYGSVDCIAGDVVLFGRYINLGEKEVIACL